MVFAHPITHERLPIQETAAAADREREQLCVHDPRIELASFLVPNVTTEDDISQRLKWVEGDPMVYPHFAHVKRMKSAAGDEWIYYVDRPSPLFTTTMEAVVEFDGNIAGSMYDQLSVGGACPNHWF